MASMQTSLAITALFMGVVGGPHCVAMCGAACTGIARAAGERGTRALLAFQLSRIAGYTVLGALAAELLAQYPPKSPPTILQRSSIAIP